MDEKDTEITKKTVDEAAKKKALDIVEKAKQKGKITYAELANELDDTNPENIDKVFDAFEDMGVSVLKEDDLDLEEPDIDELEAVEDIKVEENTKNLSFGIHSILNQVISNDGEFNTKIEK